MIRLFLRISGIVVGMSVIVVVRMWKVFINFAAENIQCVFESRF